jgi:hypothetical protein
MVPELGIIGLVEGCIHQASVLGIAPHEEVLLTHVQPGQRIPDTIILVKL